LAMSSRNSYLNAEERRSALCLKESIDLAGEMVQDGEKNSEIILMAVRKLILGYPYTKIDYVNICDPKTMEDRDTIEGERLLALAVFVGKTRLIDNCIIEA
jgi:pantoate--beta-alanine ligase